MKKTNSMQEQYKAPTVRTITVDLKSHILAGSDGDSMLYSDPNSAGNDMRDDERYMYDF